MILMCPHCNQVSDAPLLPLEPLFSYASSARIVPCSESGLRQLVSRYKDRLKSPIFRRHPTRPQQRIRFLYSSDLVTLRSILFSHERFVSNKKDVK